MKKNYTIVAIGAVLMAVAFAASLIGLGWKLASGGFTSAAPVIIAGGVQATLGSDGIQRATLSFAGFNYSPDVIRLRKGVPVEITADLTKLQGCFSTFAAPEFNVMKQFTATDTTIAFTPHRLGTFRFSCAMGMGRGKFVVEG